jgi:F420-dependent oxidoreductase-like protein
MIKVGLQIPNFTYPDTAPGDLFEKVAAVAVAAEDAGADTVMVMDHFYQLPLLGPPEHEMFEAYTLLGALATRTKTVKLGTLVTGVTYRNPAILAKIVTTLDVISSGRAFLGIGAAWYDVEHAGLGVRFPPVKERFERLEEALHICRAMFRGERPTIDGTHYSVSDAINSPAPVTPGGPPIMIGGQGEKKTMRLMAEHAEMANLTSGFDEIPHKLEVLEGHCATAGRDFATLNKTPLCSVVVGDTMEGAEALRNDFLRARGLDWDTLDDATRALVGARLVVGDADAAGERVRDVIALGMDGLTFNMPANGHDPEAVAHTVQVVKAAVG